MEGENDSSDGNPSSTTPEAEVQASNIPPIAGFWLRVLAFLIDGAVLGVAGQVLGWSMSTFWFQVGPYVDEAMRVIPCVVRYCQAKPQRPTSDVAPEVCFSVL